MCGRFTAEQRDNVVSVALTLQRLQVVRDGNQVYFRRQLHCRVAPVAVGKNAQLAAGDQRFDLLLHRLKSFSLLSGQSESPCNSAAAFAGSAFSALVISTQSSAES